MAAGYKITIKDRGLRRLAAKVHSGSQAKIEVGILEKQGQYDYADPSGREGKKIIDIANATEFGTPTSPARSFVRGYADKHRKDILSIIRVNLTRAISGDLSIEDAYREAGQAMESGMVQFVMDRGEGSYAENADYTVKKKGSDIPNVDSGQLLSAISYRVSLKTKELLALEAHAQVLGRASAKADRKAKKAQKAASRAQKRADRAEAKYQKIVRKNAKTEARRAQIRARLKTQAERAAKRAEKSQKHYEKVVKQGQKRVSAARIRALHASSRAYRASVKNSNAFVKMSKAMTKAEKAAVKATKAAVRYGRVIAKSNRAYRNSVRKQGKK